MARRRREMVSRARASMGGGRRPVENRCRAEVDWEGGKVVAPPPEARFANFGIPKRTALSPTSRAQRWCGIFSFFLTDGGVVLISD